MGKDVFNNCLFIDTLKSDETSSIDLLTVGGEELWAIRVGVEG